MKLKDAIRYFELTGCDIFTDLKKQKEYMTYLTLDFDLPNDFTETIEKVGDNLLILWADTHDYKDELELPSTEKLVSMYLTSIPNQEQSQEDNDDDNDIVEAPSRFKKKSDENKTLDLIVSIVNSEMNLAQFYDLETELVIEIINRVAEKREQERKKNKKGGK